MRYMPIGRNDVRPTSQNEQPVKANNKFYSYIKTRSNTDECLISLLQNSIFMIRMHPFEIGVHFLSS